jgi:hypothetical protein
MPVSQGNQGTPIHQTLCPTLWATPILGTTSWMFPPPTGSSRKETSLCPLPIIRSKGDQKGFRQLCRQSWPIYPGLYYCDPNLWIRMDRYHILTRPNPFLLRKTMGPDPGQPSGRWFPLTTCSNTHSTREWRDRNSHAHIAQVVPLVDPQLGSKCGRY